MIRRPGPGSSLLPRHMPPTVNPRIPLSLLEAVRRIDTPEEDPDAEYLQELRNKRLGLSDTVYQQFRRYTDAVKRGQAVAILEAMKMEHTLAAQADGLISELPWAVGDQVSEGAVIARFAES